MGTGKPADAIYVAVPLMSITLNVSAIRKTAAKIKRAMRTAAVAHAGVCELVVIGTPRSLLSVGKAAQSSGSLLAFYTSFYNPCFVDPNEIYKVLSHDAVKRVSGLVSHGEGEIIIIYYRKNLFF